MRLILTRPEPEAARSAAELTALGHEVLVAPLLRIVFLAPDLGQGPWAAVALTSANAARAIATHPRFSDLTRLPAYAVGNRSAAAARGAGFGQVVSADGALGDLARLLAGRVTGRVLYLAGEERAGEFAVPGLTVDLAVVYRAVAVATLPEAIVAALEAGRIDGVLHYSRRSAEAFLGAAKGANVLNAALRLAHYCLSAEVAAPLVAAGARVQVAPRPDETALFALISA